MRTVSEYGSPYSTTEVSITGLEVQEGETIFKSDEWWKAVVLHEGHPGLEVAAHLW